MLYICIYNSTQAYARQIKAVLTKVSRNAYCMSHLIMAIRHHVDPLFPFSLSVVFALWLDVLLMVGGEGRQAGRYSIV
jgi:hypothetical protein